MFPLPWQLRRWWEPTQSPEEIQLHENSFSYSYLREGSPTKKIKNKHDMCHWGSFINYEIVLKKEGYTTLNFHLVVGCRCQEPPGSASWSRSEHTRSRLPPLARLLSFFLTASRWQGTVKSGLEERSEHDSRCTQTMNVVFLLQVTLCISNCDIIDLCFSSC